MKGKDSDSEEAPKVEVSESSKVQTSAPVGQLDVPLIVSGCQNQTISDIVKGSYFRHGSNHGKPVYKKKQEEVPDDDDDLDVLIYFWDDRDGDENCGWWFSPSVGGEMVWAYHPSRKAFRGPGWGCPVKWRSFLEFSVCLLMYTLQLEVFLCFFPVRFDPMEVLSEKTKGAPTTQLTLALLALLEGHHTASC